MIEEQAKIRERAYELWEKDGCPEGADTFYWYLAQNQLKTALQLSREGRNDPEFRQKRFAGRG